MKKERCWGIQLMCQIVCLQTLNNSFTLSHIVVSFAVFFLSRGHSCICKVWIGKCTTQHSHFGSQWLCSTFDSNWSISQASVASHFVGFVSMWIFLSAFFASSCCSSGSSSCLCSLACILPNCPIWYNVPNWLPKEMKGYGIILCSLLFSGRQMRWVSRLSLLTMHWVLQASLQLTCKACQGFPEVELRVLILEWGVNRQLLPAAVQIETSACCGTLS